MDKLSKSRRLGNVIGGVAALSLVAAILVTGCEKSPTSTPTGTVTGGCAGTPSQPLAVVYPNGGETLTVGQTVTLEFCTADTVNYPIADERRPSVWLSPDDGKTWCMVFEFINQSSVEWEVPATLVNVDGQEVSIVSASCKLQVLDYMVTEILDLSDGTFTIKQ